MHHQVKAEKEQKTLQPLQKLLWWSLKCMRQEIKACHRYQCQIYITKYLPLHSFMTNITLEIPPLQTERTYFQVFLPKEAKDPSLPMFFCSKWSVGKVVDFAASQASLKNNNNVLTAKVSYTAQHKTLFYRTVPSSPLCTFCMSPLSDAPISSLESGVFN